LIEKREAEETEEDEDSEWTEAAFAGKEPGVVP
jgi:hypothetical protein